MMDVPSELMELTKSKHLNKECKEIINSLFVFFEGFKCCVIQDFYIGISDTPEIKLFNEHKVRPDSNRFIILQSQRFEIANEVKKILQKLGIHGSTKPDNGRFIYSYFIDCYTSETD